MAVSGRKVPKQLTSSRPSLSSDEDLKLYCQPCDRDGPRLPAYGYCTDCKEYLCENCFTHHKRHTLSRHHTLVDQNSMPKPIPSTLVGPSQPGNLTKPCPKHKKEMIKFFCQKHKALLCNVCITHAHASTSCIVNCIPDISGKTINSKEHKDILKAIDAITEKYCKKFEDVKKMTTKSNSSLAHVLADIEKFREEINQRLDELESQAEVSVMTFKQENDKNLKTVETACDDVTKFLKATSDSIKHLNASKLADEHFMQLKEAEQMISDYEQFIHLLSDYDVKEYKFNPNKDISTLLEKERPFGILTQRSLKQPSAPQTVDMTSRQASDLGKICVKTSKDKSRCVISGMTLLVPDVVIITDQYNNAVKMVETGSQSVTDQLQLDDWPQDVTSVTSTELAVTVPVLETIQLISSSLNKLKKKRALKVDGLCFGISCCKGKLAVTFCEPAKLQIMDINGTVLTTVRGDNIFCNPVNVASSSNSIYVSDWETKTVTMLNWWGEVTRNYIGMGKPFGITLTEDGTVFVCDVDRNVIDILGDSSTRKVVLKNLKGPRAVCCCPTSNTLYFSCYPGQDKHCNFLHTFKLS